MNAAPYWFTRRREGAEMFLCVSDISRSYLVFYNNKLQRINAPNSYTVVLSLSKHAWPTHTLRQAQGYGAYSTLGHHSLAKPKLQADIPIASRWGK
jgi:hypothetical protein